MGITTQELKQKYLHGDALLKHIRQETDTCFLSMSCGKDSLAAWLVLREVFSRVVPVYKWLIPDLEFVNRSLDYLEAFFGCRIYRVPHPSLYRWLKQYTFQPPEHTGLITAARLPTFTHEQLLSLLAEDLGLPTNTWIAVGTRAADSPARRLAFAKNGPINRARNSFYPVWDMSKAELVETIRKAGVKLPAEYRIFGRSFDGLDYRFLSGIKRHFPRDYQRILSMFPLAELELHRYTFATHPMHGKP